MDSAEVMANPIVISAIAREPAARRTNRELRMVSYVQRFDSGKVEEEQLRMNGRTVTAARLAVKDALEGRHR